MKKEMMNTFFLAFAAFFIATSTNSVATNGPQQSFKLKQELVCKDYWGLEKIFRQIESAEDQSIPLKVKLQCKNRNNEIYVRNDDFKFERSSGAIDRTYLQGGSL